MARVRPVSAALHSAALERFRVAACLSDSTASEEVWVRCFGCGEEMRLIKVEPHDTNPVPGFEYHSFECPACRDIERRVVFSHDREHKIIETPVAEEAPPPDLPDDPKRGFLGRTI